MIGNVRCSEMPEAVIEGFLEERAVMLGHEKWAGVHQDSTSISLSFHKSHGFYNEQWLMERDLSSMRFPSSPYKCLPWRIFHLPPLPGLISSLPCIWQQVLSMEFHVNAGVTSEGRECTKIKSKDRKCESERCRNRYWSRTWVWGQRDLGSNSSFPINWLCDLR